MDTPTRDDRNEALRITREEALSEHVDDLLKRQMSLRGEPGITRDHGRRWFYQNWFVFMLVAALAALAAWAMIEPSFDDMPWVQGPLTEVSAASGADASLAVLDTRTKVSGTIMVRGERVLVLGEVKYLNGGRRSAKGWEQLKSGREVRVYLAMSPVNDQIANVALFIELSPKPLPSDYEQVSLQQLAARSAVAGMLLFPLVGGLIGLALGAADGVVCRQLRRAALGGGIGLLVGLLGGFLSGVIANIVYAPLTALAMRSSDTLSPTLGPLAFALQMSGRGLAWAIAGAAMGLGQGIALRSKRLFLYGLLGGIVGGLLGGLLFDPIDMVVLGRDKPSGHWSRAIGLLVVGGSVGALIGVVELLARDAWLLMTAGPLAGKEFLLFKDTMKVGASPRSDIYLFNDPAVAAHHATLRGVGDECEIECVDRGFPVLVNDRPVRTARLRHGDRVIIGRTAFTFQKRQG